MKRFALILTAVCLASCADSNPAAPTAPPATTTTKVIRLTGSLNFGDVGMNQAPPDQLMTINNDGTGTLSVSGMAAPCGGTGLTVIGSTAFLVAAGGSVPVTVRFRPTTVQSCSGNLTVTSDATSGTGTLAVTARGTLDGIPIFTRTVVGDNLVTIPSYVTRVRIDATYGASCQNFIVRPNGGTSIINVIIGTCSIADTRSPFSGTYTVPAGATLSSTSSTGVTWTVTEVR